MSLTLLEQIEQMVDQLDPADQAKLYDYLSPRIQSKIEDGDNAAAWKEFIRIRNKLAKNLKPSDESIVDTLSKMRR